MGTTTNPDGPTRVAFLRGMNVGGRRLTNDELRAAVQGCGCHEPRTFQASGNLVLVDERSDDELAASLEAGLATELGYAVPVFLRTADEVRALAAASPFTSAELAASTGSPQVIFLGTEPDDAAADRVRALVPAGDRVAVAQRALHWLPAAGIAGTTFDFRQLDALVAGTTVRTHATLQRLTTKFL